MSSARQDQLEAHFRWIDIDGNGLIDFEEFRRLLNKMGANRGHAVIRLAFAAIDTDNNGQIDLVEFSNWWSQQSEQPTAGISATAEDNPEP